MVRRSLGFKIVLSFIFIAAVPFAVISAIFYLQTIDTTRSLIQEDLSRLISAVGISIDRTIFEAYDHIRILSENPTIKSDISPLTHKLSEMQKMHNFYKIFEDITLLNLEGVILASTTYDFRGDWKYKDWFRRAREGEVLISPVHSLLNPFRLVFIVTAPVFDREGAVKEVVAGRVNLAGIWGIADRIRIGRTGFIFILDRNGNFISHPNKDRLLRRLEPESLRISVLNGTQEIINFPPDKGKGRIYISKILEGYTGYKGQGWRMGITQDRSEAYSTVDKMWAQIAAVAISTFAIIILISLLFTRNIIRPIKKLFVGTKRIAQGDLDYKVRVETRDELGELAESFNTMAADLKESTVSIAELKKEQRRFQDVVESTGDWIWETDAQGSYVYASPVVEKVLGCKVDEILGKYFYDFFHPDEREVLKNRALEVFKEKKAFKNFVNRNIRKDGKEVILETSGVPILGGSGILLGYRGVDRDITERKNAEKKLQESEERLSIVLDSIQSGILLIEWDTHIIVDANPAASQMIGLSKEEIVGRECFKFICPKGKGDCPITDEEKIINNSEEILLTAKDERMSVLKTVVPVNIKGKRYLLDCFIDITERKKAEEELKKAYIKLKNAQIQLVQAEKFHAVGQLASGVAHEVKNPLAIIIQSINYLESQFSGNKDVSEILGMIKESTQRANNIVKGLVDFSRETKVNIKPEDINILLSKTANLMKHHAGKANVEVGQTLKEDLPQVLIDAGRIEQVLINLCLNSIQSMPKGGTLMIRSYTSTIEGIRVGVGRRKSDLFKVGERVAILEIEDTGSGIKEEYLNRVFEPFFTTKGPKQGSGLGLAVVKNIIDMHGGIIEIQSREGKGTKVTITLKVA